MEDSSTVLLTNPSNPLSTTVKRSVLEDVLDFVARNNIHLISDEIYFSSVFAAPDLVSVAELVESRERRGDDGIAERVHIMYSLSKDLGLPGCRVSLVYSYNDAVVTTARRMSSFTLVSSETQKTLADMLSDADFANVYIRTNREHLQRGTTTSSSGWFRVWFANMSLDTLDVALARMSRFMDRWNKETAVSTKQQQH